MYTHVLVATDGSELSDKALRQGFELARGIGARATVVTVSPTFQMSFSGDPFASIGTPDEFRRECAAEAQRILGAAREAASKAGVACQGVHVEDDRPYQAIIDTAAKRGCDLIVMASHGRKGVSALLLGSETTKVLTHTRIPVLVCR